MAGTESPDNRSLAGPATDDKNLPRPKRDGDEQPASKKDEHTSGSNPLVEFGQSLAYSIAEQPLRAGAQVIDALAGSKTEASVRKAFSAIGVEQPKPAEFGTLAWGAQQFGTAIGMLPYMRLPKGLHALEAVGTAERAVAPSLLAASLTEARQMGRSGFVYGAVFTPTEGDAANGGLLNLGLERLKQGTITGASFAAMGFANPGTAKFLSDAGRVVESSALPSAFSSPIARALSTPLSAGIASGVPAGFVNAEIGAWEQGKLYASGDELKEGIVGMSMIGGVFAGAQMAKGAIRARTSESRTNSNQHTDWTEPESAHFEDHETLAHDRLLDDDLYIHEMPYHSRLGEIRGRAARLEPPKPPWGDETPANIAELAHHERMTIAHVWDKLSEQQRSAPGEQLFKQADVISSLHLSSEQAHQLQNNLDFIDYFKSNSLVIKNRVFPTTDLFEAWTAHPEFRQHPARELLGLHILPEEMRNLPENASLPLARATSTMQLTRNQAKFLTNDTEFMPWYERNASGMERLQQTHETPSLILKRWSEMPTEMRAMDAASLYPIAKVWDQLTPTQKAMSASDITAISKLDKDLFLSEPQVQKVDAEFLRWFESNRTSDDRLSMANDSYRQIVDAWPTLNTELRALPFEQLKSVVVLPQSIQLLPAAERARFERAVRQMDLRPEQAAKLDASFIEWFDSNHDSIKALLEKHRYTIEPRQIAAVWPELPQGVRELPLDQLNTIADSWDKLSQEQRNMPPQTVATFAEIIKSTHCTHEEAAKLSALPEYVEFYQANKPASDKLNFDWNSQMHGLLQGWERIPASLRRDARNGSKSAIEDLLQVGKAWDELSDTQQKSDRKTLVRIARAANELYLSGRDKATISRDFLDWYDQLKRATPHIHHLSDTARQVLRGWSEMPQQVKSLPLERLEPVAGSWDKLSERQKKLPIDDLVAQAETIKALHLEGEYAKKLADMPDFVEWQHTHDESTNGYSHLPSETDFRKTLIDLWTALPEGRRHLTLEQATAIGMVWEKLTPDQRALPIIHIAAHANAINELNLDAKLIKKLAENPEYATWFARQPEPTTTERGSDATYYRKERHQKILEAWDKLPEHTRDGSSYDLATIAGALDLLSPEQLKLPTKAMSDHAYAAITLELSQEQTAGLLQRPGFVEVARHAPSKGMAKAIYQIWDQLPESKKQLSHMELYDATLAWDKLEPRHLELPNEQFVALTRIVNALGLSKEQTAKVVEIPELIQWHDKFKSSLSQDHSDSWSYTASAKQVVNTWLSLPPEQHQAFHNWLTNNYRGTPNQLHYLDKVVSAWPHFSEGERRLPAGQTLEKAQAINDLVSASQVSHAQSASPSIPSEFVETFTKLKPWQQIAALEAVKIARAKHPLDDGWTTTFETEFGRRLSEGRHNIIARSTDLPRVIRDNHPQMEPVFVDLIANSLKNEQEPHRFVRNLLPAEYKTVLGRMLEARSGIVDDLAKSNLIQAADNPFVVAAKGGQAWENDAALKLLTTFGKTWPRWMELQSRKGKNAHDATMSLALTQKADADGLGPWMLRFHDKPETETSVVAQRWAGLSPEVREQSYKDVLSAAMSMKYPKQRDPHFAVEAARWGISEEKYSAYESRFMRSLETPSPFPLEKSWSLNGLTLRFIPRSDARGVFLGKYTDCCQHPEHSVGNPAAWMGQENPNAGFIVVENKRNEIVAQSLAWEADNGALMLDSIEGKGLGTRETTVARLYEMMADTLKDKYHRVNVGVGPNAGKTAVDLTRWSGVPDEQLIPKPFDYGGYSDTSAQRMITQNPNLKPIERAPSQAWMRGAETTDADAARQIMQRVYPEGWQFVAPGDWYRVLEVRGKGIKGGYVLDTQSRSINDMFVDPDYRAMSRTVIFDMLRKLRSMGPEPWNANMRDSTSFKLLEQAVKARRIMIHDQRRIPGAMSGEDMHQVRFSLIPQGQ